MTTNRATVGTSKWPPKERRVHSINIVKMTRNREIGLRRSGTEFIIGSREFHWSICPKMTVPNVDKPCAFLRKFTPNGLHLIAFSPSQTSVIIYDYMGVAAAGHLLASSDIMVCHENEELYSIEARRDLFQSLFRQRSTVTVISEWGEDILNKDCSLLTGDSRHLLVASSRFTSDRLSTLADYHQSTESLCPSVHMPLEDICLFSIDILHGRLCDQYTFKCDKVMLSHNQGLHLHDRLLAVLSLQHQAIHLFQVESELGRLLPLQRIGRFLFDDDQMLLQSSSIADPSSRSSNCTEICLNGLKQRILSWLYRKAALCREQWKFFKNFDYFRYLRVWKMQMVDANRFLLRMIPEEIITTRMDPSSQPSWYVLFDWKKAEVLGVYDCYSTELLDLLEKCADQFRYPDGTVHFPTSFNLCYEAKNAYERYKRTLDNAKGGSTWETTRRILGQLPYACQTLMSTPYLDVSMFTYDEKLISQNERPKASGDCSIRFYSRRTGGLAFCVDCGLSSRREHSPVPVIFIPHPSDPFLISLQRSSNNRAHYIVNFHLPFPSAY